MNRRRMTAAIVQVAMGLLWAGAVYCQGYPAKPVRIITAEPGGGNDFAARVLGQGLARSLGQPFIVENRGGAGGAIAAEAAAKAPADGYTLLLYAGNVWTIPLLRSNVQYDAIRDFAPITWIAKSPNTVIVHPSLPVKNIRELIALAKARPGQLNYASGGSGSATHLSVELFKSMAGVNITHVPYKGTGPMITEILGGQVPIMMASTASVRPHVLSGRMRALGISIAKRSPAMPDIPTIAEAGVPGFNTASWVGLIGPRGLPPAIITRLNAEIANAIRGGELRDKLASQGFMPEASTPQQFAAHIREELDRFRKLVKSAGLKEE